MNRLVTAALALVCLICAQAQAGGWPQYRADAARSGYTPENLPDGLALRWIYHPRHAPNPAWEGVDTRMPFDHAFHTVIADGLLLFGSSADCKVYALDAGTGQERWSFFTGSPVRFAPSVWKDRVFAVSDDGFLYCLSLGDGRPLWKKRPGPDSRMLLGNDRMVSRWPARGGAVVDGDVVYFGAGIWPSEGIYLCALDPSSGKVLWANDSSGALVMDQPHGGARAKSGVSAQGYLAASDKSLFVPTGRAVPAAFDLKNGAFKYFHHQANRASGGSRVMVAGPLVFADGGNSRAATQNAGDSKVIFFAENGDLATADEIQTTAVAILPGYLVCAEKDWIKAFDLAGLFTEKTITDRRGNPAILRNLSAPSWTISTPGLPGGISLIAAGDKIISGTTNNKVAVLDVRTRKVVWSAEVDGAPLGLAVSDSCLFVSTEKGTLYCFDSRSPQKALEVRAEILNFPYENNRLYAAAAEEIIALTGVTDGYCIDLGCGDGNLAFELARRTNLRIYAIDPDPAKVALARKKLDAAGFYGVRVTVHLGDPRSTPYPDYFANLAVSGRSVSEGAAGINQPEMIRLLRPYGGTNCVGRPGGMTKTVRGELDGADPEWTHLYHDPANTLTSGDELVKGRLSMLWFRDSDFEMPSRHGRGVGPLFSRGRLFVEGLNALRAVDAYNGRTLWEYPLYDILKAYDQEHLVGAAATQGNICLEGERIYIRSPVDPTSFSFAGQSCLVLDAATGRKLAEYPIPDQLKDSAGKAYWGYLAVENGVLFGSVADIDHVLKYAYGESDMNELFSESRCFFALDASTGKLKWSFTPEHSIRHNAIAIGGGKVYLIDRPQAVSDALRRNPHRAEGSLPKPGSQPTGTLLALDCTSGKVLWRNGDNIYGTLLALSTEYNSLVMTYQFTRFKQSSELGNLMTAFRTSDGKRLWEVETGVGAKQGYSYSSRPLLNGKVIYLEPGAYDLGTGERLDFRMERSYNCGILTGCRNMLVFRSATMGFLELAQDRSTENYGGIRPGCWINALPVGGLVLMPDATARCNCSYLIKANIALQPLGR